MQKELRARSALKKRQDWEEKLNEKRKLFTKRTHENQSGNSLYILSTISKISNNSYLKVSFGLPSSLSNHVIKLISQKQFEMVIINDVIQIYTYCRNSSDMTENKNQKPILPDKPCTVTAFLLESNIMGSVEGLISEESE
jgi:hypothetical protein